MNLVVSLGLLMSGILGITGEKLDLLGKRTWQKSTLRGYHSNNPINGNIGPNNCGDGGFSHTQNKHNPLWQVDLGQLYIMEKVKVMTRQGWSIPIEVYVSKQDRDSSFETQCGVRLNVSGHLSQFMCPSNTEARHVTVKRPTKRGDPQALVLCNVEVYARKKVVDCGIPTPSHIMNGQLSYTTTTQGSIVTYRCNTGYRLSGAATSKCSRQEKRWVRYGDVPFCSVVRCGKPRDPQKGYHEERTYVLDNFVTYKCNPGYTISGTTRSKCTAAGTWSSPPPTCNPIYCRNPGHPHSGKREGDNFLFDSVVEFICDEGYRLQGPQTIRCGTDGRWSDSTPRCYPINCDTLAEPVNGHVIAGSGHTVGSFRSYACDLGYDLVGAASIRCEDNNGRGRWSGSIPTCQKRSCDRPMSLENGQIQGTDYTFGASVLYSCARGYRLEGPSRRTCQVHGWTGTQPKCNPISCRDPGTLTNGQRSTNTNFTFGTIVTYTCDTGYTIKGQTTSTCGIDGLWSNRKPECEPVTCDQIRIPQHGSKEGDIYEYPKTITFACFPGYSLVGSASTTCKDDGTWSKPSPICRDCDVGYYKETVGYGTCTKCPARSTTVTTASTRKEHCSCVPGTSGPLGGPCQVVTCEQLSPPENGTMTDCSTSMGSECILSCNKGYVRSGGAARRVCTETGWTGNPVSCTACPADSYTMFEGVDTCTPCPRHTETNPGEVGQSLQSCVCKHGFYGPEGGPCADFDECLLKPCNGTCVNTEGFFYCRCDIPGYILAEDKKTCIINETCKELKDTPNSGSLDCRYTSRTNGYVCYIQCNPGYYFVSGINDYVTCGKETMFEWSHRLVNISARIPACTREHFIDVDLPVTLKYTYNSSCAGASLSTGAMSETLNEVVNTISTCNDKCKVHDIELECTDVVGAGSELTATFKLMLTNVRPNEVPPDCTQRCKLQNMREILTSMRKLSNMLKSQVKENPEKFDLKMPNSPRLNPDSFVISGRPNLLCEAGHVFTVNRLCVPCDGGHYLPSRDKKTCLPCPKGQYQEKQGQTNCNRCLDGATTMGEGSDHPVMCSERVATVIRDEALEA